MLYTSLKCIRETCDAFTLLLVENDCLRAFAWGSEAKVEALANTGGVGVRSLELVLCVDARPRGTTTSCMIVAETSAHIWRQRCDNCRNRTLNLVAHDFSNTTDRW